MRIGDRLAITLYGRVGQGVELARSILTHAFARAERAEQTHISYGNERSGSPVRPHHAIVLDASLLPAAGGGIVRPGGVVIVNSAIGPCSFMPNVGRVWAFDLVDIAARAGLGANVAAAAIGAFAGLTRFIPFAALAAAVERERPLESEAHVAACREAYGGPRASDWDRSSLVDVRLRSGPRRAGSASATRARPRRLRHEHQRTRGERPAYHLCDYW